MASDELAPLDATAQASLVRSGALSTTDLVEAAIERIEQIDPQLNAIIHRRFERALDEAPRAAGPFAGVPIVLKDLSAHSAGDPFHCGMNVLKRVAWTEPRDSPVTAAIRKAGFVLVGRTNTPELGLMPTTEPEAYGPTRNPWKLERSPGGSSGGSAAAVAARLVPIAHATDGGGSIRIPASACGLVGLKPSRGRVPGSKAIDSAGFVVELAVTRSVRDAAAVLDVLGRGRRSDPTIAEGLRVGLMTTAPGGMTPVHRECVAAAEDAAELLGSLGHHVEHGYPPALDEIEHILHYGAVTGVDVAAQLGYWSEALKQPIGDLDVEPNTWALAEMGRAITDEQLRTSLAWLEGFTRRVLDWWGSGFDLLLTPTLAEPPPPLGELVSTRDAPLAAGMRAGAIVPFTPPFNTTGQPAISLPLHWSDEGLPIGAQLVAAPNREDLLIAVAAQLEEARPWGGRKPPVSA
jgi:amidase